MPLEDEADGRVSLMHAFAREHEICRIFFPPLPRPDLPGLAVTELSQSPKSLRMALYFPIGSGIII